MMTSFMNMYGATWTVQRIILNILRIIVRRTQTTFVSLLNTNRIQDTGETIDDFNKKYMEQKSKTMIKTEVTNF